MAVLDLNTGKPTDQVSAIQPIIEQPQSTGEIPKNIPAFPEDRGESAASIGIPADETTKGLPPLPELEGLLGGQDKAKILALTPILLATPNNAELAKIITENFPDIGQQFSPAGEIILANNKTGVKVLANRPGLSKLDLLQAVGIGASFLPAASVATKGTTLASKALIGSGAAGLTQAAIEGIQKSVGGTLDEVEIAIASALGGVAELVTPIIQSFRQSRQAAKIGAEVSEIKAVSQQIKGAKTAAEGLEKATGKKVGVFQAQQTLQPSELLKQRLLPQLDAGSKKAASALEKQNKEVFEATTELIEKISPKSQIASGSSRFKTASKKAIDAANQRRLQDVKPLFNQAIKEGAKVDLKPVRSLVDEALLDAPPTGDLAKVMRKIGNLIRSPNKKERPSLRQLQKAKFQLDDMLERFGDGALGNTVKRDVVAIKKQLVNQMEKASPLFKAAQKRFSELTPAVKELEDSILGQVSKLDDVNLKNISQKIFDPKAGLTNPSQIKNAKKIIDQVDPGAWDDLLRVELNRRVGGLEQLVEDIPGELVGNIPGQLRRAIFGNPSQRNALLSGMNKDQRKNFVFLDEVLRRSSAGRAAGSPTTPFKEIVDKLRGVSAVILEFIFSPLQKTGTAGGRLNFDKNVKALTNLMFDVKFERQLAQLRKLDPNSPAAARAMAQLLKQAQEKEGKNDE